MTYLLLLAFALGQASVLGIQYVMSSMRKPEHLYDPKDY